VNRWWECLNDRRVKVALEVHLVAKTEFSDSVGLVDIY
jgi:hypothetical protein